MKSALAQMNNSTPTERLGRVYEDKSVAVHTEVWRYVLGADGQETGYVKREAGRPVVKIAQEIIDALKATRGRYGDATDKDESMIDEYAAIGHEYRYESARLDDTPTEWPAWASVECTAVVGTNEGHYVHVDMMIHVREGRKRPIHVNLVTVKTFRGFNHAWVIAARATELLGGKS